MGIRYGQDAIEKCREFYVQFGANGNEIQKAMQRIYPSWRKSNLYDTKHRHGWITKFGFEKSLKIHLGNQINSVESDDERRYSAIVQLADKWQTKALSDEDDKAVDKFIKLTTLQVELRNKLDLSSSNFETFVEAFEQIVSWSKDIDTNLAKAFYKRKDKFIERAVLKYGKNADNR